MTNQPRTLAVCDTCGRSETDAAALITWSVAEERGRPHRCCASCSRAHLRSMEARLGPEHW